MTLTMVLFVSLFATLGFSTSNPIDAENQAAFESIDATKIMADLVFVACDDMEGRDTPSPGQRLTARFLRNRLQRLDWQPGAKNGWFHTYPLTERVVDPSRCSASMSDGAQEVELEFAKDYLFTPIEVEDIDASGEIVYFASCGDVVIEDGSDLVEGRWVFIDNTDGFLESLLPVVQRAGAIGVLTTVRWVSGASKDGNAGVVFDLWEDLMRGGLTSWPKVDPHFPRVYLPQTTIDTILELGGVASPTSGEILAVEFSETRRYASNRRVPCENVVGFWPGEGARDKTVILSAHYDHIGVDDQGRPFNGADDNASGTCALLAIAEALSILGPLDYSVMLIWLSGEERGLWGSQAFVEDPWFPHDSEPVANINLDMIGRNDLNTLGVAPSKAHEQFGGLSRLLIDLAYGEGFSEIENLDPSLRRSDQANFAKLGIPVAFLSSGLHEDYHTISDDPERIDGEKIARVARVLFRLLLELEGNLASIEAEKPR